MSTKKMKSNGIFILLIRRLYSFENQGISKRALRSTQISQSDIIMVEAETSARQRSWEYRSEMKINLQLIDDASVINVPDNRVLPLVIVCHGYLSGASFEG